MKKHPLFSTDTRCQDQDASNQPLPLDQPGDTVVAVEERPEPKPTLQKPPVDRMPLWKVLLHNDDVSEVDHVVESIVMLTPLGIDEAIEKMKEAHETGVSLLMTTHQEKAELIQDQFTSRKLTVTIEPDKARPPVAAPVTRAAGNPITMLLLYFFLSPPQRR